MKIAKILLVLAISFQTSGLLSQVLLTEGFEGGIKPDGWIEEAASGNEPWRYRNGGHSPNDNNWQVPPDQEDITRNPAAAYEGTYNAIFFKQGTDNERTKLITPPLNLMGAAAIELSFQLCQIPWTFEGATGWDVLRIYYKRADADPWILLEEYLDPIYEWEEQRLNLPNPSDEYYVAFEGHTRWGFGTCIDAISIQETGTQDLYIGDIEFHQPFPNIIPSGSPDVPMMRTDLKVYGNTGSLSLDQISFASLNTDDGDVESGGVKLWATSTQTFDRNTPLGTATDFSGGTATFSGLSHALDAGANYLWLTYDVALDAVHENVLDVEVRANAISAGGSSYPSTDQSPDGYRLVYETRYYEGFEGAHNWVLSGEFEVAAPDGMGGNPGNANPTEAYRGTLALGTDLTGLGSYPYHYEPAIGDGSAYTAATPTIDAVYFKNLKLFFQRYLNIEVWDNAAIEISNDDGSTWNTLWENNSYLSDFQWVQTQIDIPDEYARKDQLKFRFKLGPTDAFENYTGWNIDEFYLTGEFISKDVGISEWVYPLTGSGHSDQDSVTVRIRNYGGAEITDPVPVAYSFDGGLNWTVDMMTQNIPVDGEVTFTFPSKVDLSQPGPRPEVLARTTLPGDQFSGNDQLATEIYIIPTYVAPYLQDFEEGPAYWRSMGNLLWEHGEPGGSSISQAASGSSAWMTGLSADYGDVLTQNAQVIFEDDFESDLGWTFGGEFEREVPSNIYVPYFANSGFFCLGTDLSGLGANPYLYENGIRPGTAYTATSPTIDVSDYSNLYLSYSSWTTLIDGDSVRVEISTDNGSSWHTLWKNSGAISEYAFESYELNIPDIYSHTSELKIRFSLFYSNASGIAEGWNIDDVMLQGDLINQEEALLSSPSFDLSNLQNPVLSSSLWVDSEQDVDGCMLQYSLDDGQSWITMSNVSSYDSYWNWYTGSPVSSLSDDGWSGHSGSWIQVKHLLPAGLAGQANVQFRFVFKNDKVNNAFDGIAMDDFRLMEAPADLDLVQILEPLSACELSEEENFRLRMRNSGMTALQAGDSLQVTYQIDRSGEIQTGQETYVLGQSWSIGASLDLNMNALFDFGQSGMYESTVYLETEDPYFYNPVSNDTSILTIEVRKPAVELGEDISTSRPDTVLLVAGPSGGDQSYLWQDSSTDTSFQVLVPGTYHVRVENGLGCVASDTIEVLQLVIDVGVSAYLGLESACEIPDPLTLSVRVENMGTDTLSAGEQIEVSTQIDGLPPISDMVVLSGTFRPGESFDHTFPGTFNFSMPGDYTIKTWTDLATDTEADNDTLVYLLQVYGYPDADLGSDRVVDAASYLLAPESGHSEYLWQDGSTGESFLVEQEGIGLYHVWINDENGCSSADTVVLTLNVTDLELLELLSPATSCELSESITISARVRNAGNQTISSGEIIPLGYQIDGGSVVNGSHTLSQDLLPGHTLDYTFPIPETVVTGQWYDFTVFVAYGPDVKEFNDTIETNVGVFQTPNLNLGEDFQVITGLEHTLNAGPGFVSYLWQDGSTNETFTITQPGIGAYHVAIEDLNGCTVSDTITLMLNVPDVGIVAVNHPVSTCHLEAEEYIEVGVKNFGNNSIDPGEEIEVSYSLNGSDTYSESLILTEALESGDTILYLFSRPEDMSVPGLYDIIAWTTYAADLISTNDNIFVTVDHRGSPQVDIGNGEDSLNIDGPLMLMAMPGYASYLWHDSSTSNEFQIADYSAGWYWVEVSADNGCMIRDSVHVIYDLPDLEVQSLLTPANSCSVEGESIISAEILNLGYYRIGTSDTLLLSYQVNSGASVFQEVLLDQELQPGSSVVLSFDQGFDFSQTGDYDIRIDLVYDPDENLVNNQLNRTISIWENPVLDLAGGEDTLTGNFPITLDGGGGHTSYLWGDGSTTQSIQANSEGWHVLTVGNLMGCTDTDSVYAASLTAIEPADWEPGDIRIYPNPVNETLFIELELKGSSQVHLELYSMSGVLMRKVELDVKSNMKAALDVHDIIPGAYALRIFAEERHYHFRVLVE